VVTRLACALALSNVFTDEDYRRSGLARTLVDRAMSVCSDLGIKVFSFAASAEAARMYSALGFVPYAEEMILRRSWTRQR